MVGYMTSILSSIYFRLYLKYLLFIFFSSLYFYSTPSLSATLDAVKINSLGVYAAGSAIPRWLGVANVVGAFAGKWNPYIAIGSTIIAAALSDYQDPPNQLTLFPRSLSGITTPDGWSGPNNPPSTSATTTTNKYCINSTNCYTDTMAYCKALAQCCASSAYLNSPYFIFVENNKCMVGYPGYPSSSFGNLNPVLETTCPSGYQLVSGSCVLSEGATWGYNQWTRDQMASVYPDPVTHTWANHPRDPDNASNPALGVGTDTISRSGYDSVGNPTNETSKINSDGSTTITRDQQGVDSSGSTAVQRDSITYNIDGRVTNVSTQTFTNSPITNINTSNPPSVDVSALAKDATLQETNNKLGTINTTLTQSNTKLDESNSKLSDIKSTLTETNSKIGETNIKLGEIKNKLDKDESNFSDIPQVRTISESLSLVFNAIRNKFIPPTFQDSASTCPVWQTHIPYLNVTFVVDELCVWEPDLKPIISSVMLAVWCFLGIKILLSA